MNGDVTGDWSPGGGAGSDGVACSQRSYDGVAERADGSKSRVLGRPCS